MQPAHRAFLEAVMLIEALCSPIYSVNQYGARANLFRSSHTTLKSVLKQRRPKAALLFGFINREACQENDGNWMSGLMLCSALRGVFFPDA